MQNIRSTVAALLVIGAAASAAAQGTAKHAGHGQAKHAARGAAVERPGFGPARALLRGITLSDAEKANLKTIRAQYAAQTKLLHEQFKPQHEAMRTARKSGDTAAVRALMQKAQAQHEQVKQLMLAQRNDIRSALTTANQAKFDENVARIEQRLAQRPDSARKHPRRPPGARGLSGRP
jgi:Spy/CpxP family protein refolding chaperone